jgi:hypothetical protein
VAKRNKSGQKIADDIVVKWRKLAELENVDYRAKHFVDR